MVKRAPGSERAREALNDLIDGRLRVDDAESELVRLARRLIIEEGLEAEVRDALDRGSYERGGSAGGPRNGVRKTGSPVRPLGVGDGRALSLGAARVSAGPFRGAGGSGGGDAGQRPFGARHRSCLQE